MGELAGFGQAHVLVAVSSNFFFIVSNRFDGVDLNIPSRCVELNFNVLITVVLLVGRFQSLFQGLNDDFLLDPFFFFQVV